MWGPDGLLYVGGFSSDAIHRYDADGHFVDRLEASVDGPDSGTTFGPDGMLYVPCFDGNEVVVIDPASGAVVERITDGMVRPRAVHVDDDGSRWVSAWGLGALVRFDADGERLSDLPTRAPTGFAIGAEGVWVGTDQGGKIRLIDPATAEVLRTVAGSELGIEGVTAIRWE